MIKVLLENSGDNTTILSHSEKINDMLNTLENGLAEMKQLNGMYDSSAFVLKLINFKNGIEDLINDLAFTCA